MLYVNYTSGKQQQQQLSFSVALVTLQVLRSHTGLEDTLVDNADDGNFHCNKVLLDSADQECSFS